jgi:hypothetical protein
LQKKEVPEIKATVMSMFFRSRPPRKLRRKTRGKAHPNTRHQPLSTRIDPALVAVPVPVPASNPAAAMPRRRRQRASGYIPRHSPLSRFRIT